MKASKLNTGFKKLVLEIEKSNTNNEETEWLEKLRKLTGHKTVEEMIKRFKKLANIE